MPSTYNNNLRLEMIANGEQSGTWGATTNTNLGALLVDAITATVLVSVTSGNQAFTVANGAIDEARCAAIVLSTTTGANFNVYAPSVAKLYVIKNDSAYQATIFCNSATPPAYSPAGAGYNIPAGKTVFIRASNESGSWQFTNCIDSFGTTGLSVQSGGTGLATIPAFSVPVANSLNTLTALTVAANQSIRLNSAGTAWEAYPVSAGGISAVTGTPPVTSSGGSTPAIGLAANYGDTQNPYASKPANYVLASPDGSAGVPTFRALAVADLPTVATITPNTYGSASQVAQITVDSKGRITGITNVTISGGGGGVTSVTGSGAINASPTTGAVQITVADASAGASGVVNTTSQVFAGNKTINGTLNTSGLITGGNGFLSTPGSFNFNALNEAIYASGSVINMSVGTVSRVRLAFSDFQPTNDDQIWLGYSANRWKAVYAVNGTIQTSDQNEKQDIADLDATEKRVAVRIKGLIKKFRFKDAVANKGAAARIHVGVIAQEVRDAFTAEGLDAARYGMFCSDTWWEKEEQEVYPPTGEIRTVTKVYREPVEGGTEKTRLGVRYDELLAFVIAAM